MFKRLPGKRRWFQISLRSVLILMLLSGPMLGGLWNFFDHNHFHMIANVDFDDGSEN